MTDLFGNKYSLNFFDYKNKNNKDSGEVNKVENKKEEADTFRSRFASNMADYFKDTPGSVGDRATKFSDQFEGGFDQVAEGFGIFQPRTNPMSVIPGQQGQPGLLQQVAGPIAGAAAQSFFACDMRLKHDVDCLTDMNLVKDDLADVAYFVKELQDS